MSDIAPARMLLVEDDEEVRRSLREQLADWGYGVVDTGNGTHATELLAAKPLDLILLDLHLPGRDGLEILEDVRRSRPDLATIVISGSGTIDDVVQALRLGAWDYLFKPIQDMAILRHAVTRALERRRLLREQR